MQVVNEPNRYGVGEVAMMNRTARSRGAVGGNAKVPQVAESLMMDTSRVLDFGAGAEPIHARRIQAKHPNARVDAYEIGTNLTSEHVSLIGADTYDLAYASNVLNVQPSVAAVAGVIATLARAVKWDGEVVVNLPQEPRKNDAGASTVKGILLDHFKQIATCGPGVYVARYPR